MSVVRVRDGEPIKTEGYGLGRNPFFVRAVVNGVIEFQVTTFPSRNNIEATYRDSHIVKIGINYNHE